MPVRSDFRFDFRFGNAMTNYAEKHYSNVKSDTNIICCSKGRNTVSGHDRVVPDYF